MLRTRLATAAVAIPALWLIVAAFPRWAFGGFVVLVAVIGLAEFMAMALPRHPRLRAAGVAAGSGLAVAILAGGPWPSLAMLAALVLGIGHVIRPGANLSRSVERLAIWSFGIVYIAVLLPHVVLLRDVEPDGWRWVLFTLFTAMGSDTGGYFGGRFFGRRRLAPGLSPNKTVEGAVGAVMGAALLAGACRWVLLPGQTVGEVAVLGVFISLLGQVGDLAESGFKRAFDVKDSGWIVPGHGGILDRLDSLVLPFVAVYVYVQVMGGVGV